MKRIISALKACNFSTTIEMNCLEKFFFGIAWDVRAISRRAVSLAKKPKRQFILNDDGSYTVIVKK